MGTERSHTHSTSKSRRSQASLRNMLRAVSDGKSYDGRATPTLTPSHEDAARLGALNGDWRTRRCVANAALYLKRVEQTACGSAVKVWSRADEYDFLDASSPFSAPALTPPQHTLSRSISDPDLPSADMLQEGIPERNSEHDLVR